MVIDTLWIVLSIVMIVSGTLAIGKIQREREKRKGKFGIFRRELLDCYIFNTLSEARAMAEDWMEDYNNERSHDSLGEC
jgi:hypothetical protein